MDNKYLRKNYKNSDWFNGLTPVWLKNLKGEIRTIDHKHYELEDDNASLKKTITGGTFSFSLMFNENGEIIKEISCGGKSIVAYKRFIENKIFRQEWLDESGKLIQYETFDYSNNSDFATAFYTKRVDGSEQSLQFWVENLTEDSFLYHGKDFEDLYVKNKIVERKATYSNLIIKNEYFDEYYLESVFSNGVLDKTEKFNQNDFLIELVMYDDKSAITRREIRNYDKHNNLIEKLSEPGLPEQFIYNEANLLVEKKKLSQDLEFRSVRQYEYDSYGNLIKERGDWNNADFEYTYDQFGNWVEKLEIKESKVFSKVTREIEYYK